VKCTLGRVASIAIRVTKGESVSNGNASQAVTAASATATASKVEADKGPRWDAPIDFETARFAITDEGHAIWPDSANKRIVMILDASEPEVTTFGKEGEKDFRREIVMARIGGVGKFGKRCQVDAEGLPKGKCLSIKADAKLADASEVRAIGKASKVSVW